jgi:hypothetical protein
MINAGQNSKYWRRWTRVCAANRWRWSKGRLANDAVKDAGLHHVAVWNFAGALADQNCRAVVADDLRHACHVHALGRDVSHTDFTNDQFSRVLLLLGDEKKLPGLLIVPDHVRSQMFWDNPEMQKKESLIFSIKAAANDAYIQRITADVWGTIYWEDLDVKALLGLLRKLKGNQPTF